MGDRLRNFLYPAAIFTSIATVWLIGWASSMQAKANIGYWPMARNQSVHQGEVCVGADSEQQSPVASISDGND
jgi:hypothetical protein